LPALGDVLRDLLLELAPALAGEAGELFSEALEVVVDQRVGRGGHFAFLSTK
jgi:hypothetical protein